MAELIIGSYPVFLDIDGTPLDDGFLFVGEPDLDPETNPLQAYWDEALTEPADDIRTKSGYPFNGSYPARLYINEAYSLLVKNKRELTVYEQQNSVASAGSQTNITWTPGTTAGPICNSSTGTDEAIPVASGSASGAITTGAQTLAGVKTFDSIPVVPDNPVTDSNTGAVTGNNVFDYVNSLNESGEIRVFSSQKARTGFFEFTLNNSVSQATYSTLFTEVAQRYNAQHVAMGDADLSGSGTLFYPTPVPNGFDSGWVANSDWTAMNLAITHGFATDLSDLQVRFFISTDGTENNAFEPIFAVAESGTLTQGDAFHQTDNNGITIKTASSGMRYVDSANNQQILTTNAFYYKVTAIPKGQIYSTADQFAYIRY